MNVTQEEINEINNCNYCWMKECMCLNSTHQAIKGRMRNE